MTVCRNSGDRITAADWAKAAAEAVLDDLEDHGGMNGGFRGIDDQRMAGLRAQAASIIRGTIAGAFELEA